MCVIKKSYLSMVIKHSIFLYENTGGFLHVSLVLDLLSLLLIGFFLLKLNFKKYHKLTSIRNV